MKQVNANYTCFVSLKHFDEPQTAVEVNGKKYYGCHEDCAKQLTGDPTSRVAVDPVSKKEVDKADAVVGADKAGNIYFFENQRDLKRFRVPTSVPPVPTGDREVCGEQFTEKRDGALRPSCWVGR